jgi:prephenate dehydrogenase
VRSVSTEPELTTIGVIGLGQIGGAIALRALASGAVVQAYDPDEGTQASARTQGLIVVDAPEALLAGCDLIVVAVPTPLVEDTMGALAAAAGAAPKRDAARRAHRVVVCDVASVKTDLALRIRARFGGTSLEYVSVHPMAGREQSGFAAADASLLAERVWLLPLEGTESLDAVGRVAAVLTTLFQARVLPVPLDRHDALVALTSHLPHALSFAYAGVVAATDLALAPRSAGNSFGDLTRVAYSSPTRVAEMLVPNAPALVPLVDSYLSEVTALRTLLAAEDHQGVTKWLAARSMHQEDAEEGASRVVVVRSVDELLAYARSGRYLTGVSFQGADALECRFDER